MEGESDFQAKEILNPHEKPFIFVFSGHTDGEVPLLEVWRGQLEKLFQTSSTGKVVALIEGANFTKEASDYVRDAVAGGVTPSQAMTEAKDLGLYTTDSSASSAFSKYNMARRSILDRLSRSYPGRLDLLTEANSSFTLDDYYESQLEIRKHAEVNTPRDIQFAQQVRNVLSQDNIIGGVGLLGSYHTQVSHALVKDGYNIARVFPERQGRTYSYSPKDTLRRRARFFPRQEITTPEIRTHLRVQREVEEGLSLDSPPLEKQSRYREAHGLLKEMAKRRIKNEGSS